MKCFPHLSLLCSQTPIPSHFASIIYFIARDFIDHISRCTNLALYVLSYCHVLSYCIDSELLRVTVLNTVETHMIPARLTSQRESLWKCWMIRRWFGEAALTTQCSLLSCQPSTMHVIMLCLQETENGEALTGRRIYHGLRYSLVCNSSTCNCTSLEKTALEARNNVPCYTGACAS